MKHLKKIFALFMAMTMLCGVAVGVGAEHEFPTEIYPNMDISIFEYGRTYYYPVYGSPKTGIYGPEDPDYRLPYPINVNYYYDRYLYNGSFSDRFIKSDYFNWYNNVYLAVPAEERLEFLAYKWYNSYRTDSPEIWCEEYLDIVEKYVSDYSIVTSPLDPDKMKYRVSDYTLDGRNLTIQCEADYHVMYELNEVTEGIYEQWDYQEGYLLTTQDYNKYWFYVKGCIALTNKSDGSLVYLAKHDYKSFLLHPGSCETGFYKEKPPLTEEELKNGAKGTFTSSLTVTLPEYYNSRKHNITMLFIEDLDYFSEIDQDTDDLNFLNPCDITIIPPPISGDTDGNDHVDTLDLTRIKRFLTGGKVDIYLDGADMNGDGKVTAIDATILSNSLKKKLIGES